MCEIAKTMRKRYQGGFCKFPARRSLSQIAKNSRKRYEYQDKFRISS